MRVFSFADSNLPIIEVAEDLCARLEEVDELVLEAPPGAGKTTLVPLILLDSPWLAGRKILMLEPRRMAARAAAHRMAALLGEKVGQRVGYRIRLEHRISRNTRIEVITEGILTRMLQVDPALEEVGLLIFDEFHERNIDSDLGLALALQGRELFRDTALKILVMSATLDGGAVAALLGGAPVIRSAGRQYPVEIHYGKAQPLGAPALEPVVEVLQRLMADVSSGSLLVFLPGRGEIQRVQRRLSPQEGVEVLALHGGLDLATQLRAIAPAGAGKRKLVLSTNIAETSLTIIGVDTVVDSGLVRMPAYDPASAMTRLQTRRISRASSEQRAGRAGRLGPGRCYRLWSREQQQQLAPHSTAEILQADLTSLVLQILAWGVEDPAELSWLDTPPAAAVAQALDLLEECGVFEERPGRSRVLNERGQRLARMPLHPRLGLMLLRGTELGIVEPACGLAALLSEGRPDTGGGADLLQSYRLITGDLPCPAQHRGWLQRLNQQRKRLLQQLDAGAAGSAQSPIDVSLGLLVAAAYPDRIARRRRPGLYQLASGRNASLSLDDDLCRERWLAVAELGGHSGRPEDRIFSAIALDESLLVGELAHRVHSEEIVAWDEKLDRFVAEEVQWLGALRLSATPLSDVDPLARQAALCGMLREQGLGRLAWNDESRQWQARVQLLNQTLGAPWPDVSDQALLDTLEQWLLPWLAEVRGAADLRRLDLRKMLVALLPWPLPRELDEWAPARIEIPSGSMVTVDYSASPPVLAVKLQEMFGSAMTPSVVGDRVALQVHLLSPAGRPLQVTQDLAAFWHNAYGEVRKEMKGRYPKHPWPEDPTTAVPTRHTRHRKP